MQPFVLFVVIIRCIPRKNKDGNVAQLRQPQRGYYSKRQNDHAGYVIPMQIARVPTQGSRHCTAYKLTPQNTASRQQRKTIIVDDVTDINDFMGYNVFACLCCCWPLGFIGIIFSMLCNSTKSKGKRKEVEDFSVLAKILFASSVFSGIAVVIAVILKWQHEF